MPRYSTSGYDPNAGAPPVGKAHFLVTDVSATQSDKHDGNDYKVTATIVAHEKESGVGKTYRDYFSPATEGGRNRMFSFALATGILTREQLQQENVELDMEDAYSKTFCGSLQEDSYKGKTRVKVGFTFLNPNDPESDGYPKKKELLEKQEEQAVEI